MDDLERHEIERSQQGKDFVKEANKLFEILRYLK